MKPIFYVLLSIFGLAAFDYVAYCLTDLIRPGFYIHPSAGRLFNCVAVLALYRTFMEK